MSKHIAFSGREQKALLNKVLAGMTRRIESAEKFVLAEAPELAREVIAEVILDNSLGLVISLVLVVNGLTSLHRAFILDWSNSGVTFVQLFTVISILIGAFAVLALGACVRELLYAWLCPKLLVLRKLRRLISGPGERNEE